MSVGSNLRLARKAAGLTLGALSRASGVSKGYLSQIENGHVASPTGQVLDALGQALGVTVDDLIHGSDPTLIIHARLRGWSPAVARMLSTVDVEGARPETAEDYDALYAAIRSALRKTTS